MTNILKATSLKNFVAKRNQILFKRIISKLANHAENYLVNDVISVAKSGILSRDVGIFEISWGMFL